MTNTESQKEELDKAIQAMTEAQLRMALRVVAHKRFADVEWGIAVAVQALPR